MNTQYTEFKFDQTPTVYTVPSMLRWFQLASLTLIDGLVLIDYYANRAHAHIHNHNTELGPSLSCEKRCWHSADLRVL